MFVKIKSKSFVGKLFLSLFLFCLPHQAFGLSVTTTADGNLLANTILGGGVTISNISYPGSPTQSGTFSGGIASGIGIESGVILTTGNANFAVLPPLAQNLTPDTTGVVGSVGDSDLESLIHLPLGLTTNDAAVLEFDFTSAGGDLIFNYVFASEEYNEYVGQINDVFGFFLDGSNIALIPGTSDPVSINNVNNAMNSLFYNDNSGVIVGIPGINSAPIFDIEYDGFTDVFTAQVLGLTQGTHHMKLAIADAIDFFLDSAVFIQANSFTVTSGTPPNPIPGPGPNPNPGTNSAPEPGTVLLLGSGLLGLGLWRWRENRKDC